jgi:1-phosphatidylinositol-4-phosphate 5-kinase
MRCVQVEAVKQMEERDLLVRDFEEVIAMDFPSAGTDRTPPHGLTDFRFKTYAPRTFRHFRKEYGYSSEAFLVRLAGPYATQLRAHVRARVQESVCYTDLRELSNPGASGSIFFVSGDDRFIIKTVQKKEAHFLRRLLQGYYLNLTQNKKSLLPKFYGLFYYKTALGGRIRFVVMNNILPANVGYHERFDLKVTQEG